jgi:C_GCAxxG_C_C family probable redox protein
MLRGVTQIPAGGEGKDATDTAEAIERARACFLDDTNYYGCAETTFVVLKEAFGLPDSGDSSAAMAINGGVAYSGGMCGPISGSAMAVGMLAERRMGDHFAAKRTARLLTQRLLDDFVREYGSLDCRDLIEVDLRAPGQHAAFIASDIWRDRCMRQIEFAVRLMAPLADLTTWKRAVREVSTAEP